MATFDAPPLPPPFLSGEQVDTLAYQGHIPIQLPPALADKYTTLFSELDIFFDQPSTAKVDQHPPSEGTELGYYHVKNEKEYLTLRNASERTSLERMARDTWARTVALLKRVLNDLTHALAIPPQAWEPILDGGAEMPLEFDVTSKTLMRLFKYEPNTGLAACHTDNGLLTLCMGKGKGLQLWQKTENGGHWIDAEGPTLLAGVSMRVLSSGAICAGQHRVVGNLEGRNSVVFALRPSTRHDIDLTPFHGSGTLSLAALHEQINASKVNVNAHLHLREKKQQEQRARRLGAGVESGG